MFFPPPAVPPLEVPTPDWSAQGLRRAYAISLHAVATYPYSHRFSSTFAAGIAAGAAYVLAERAWSGGPKPPKVRPAQAAEPSSADEDGADAAFGLPSRRAGGDREVDLFASDADAAVRARRDELEWAREGEMEAETAPAPAAPRALGRTARGQRPPPQVQEALDFGEEEDVGTGISYAPDPAEKAAGARKW
jgi:hypothetical protein